MTSRSEHPGTLVDAVDLLTDAIDRQDARRIAEQLHRVRETDEIVLRTSKGDSTPLPHSFVHLMASMLDELAEGHTISIVSDAKEISTTAAAKLLGVSRPHVVKLTNSGILPHRMAGSHRRIRMTDLLAYKRSVDQRHAFLDELIDEAEEMDLYSPAPEHRI